MFLRYGFFSLFVHAAALVGFLFSPKTEITILSTEPIEIRIENKIAQGGRSAGVPRGRSAKKIASILFPSFKESLLSKVTEVTQNEAARGSQQELPSFAQQYAGMDMAHIQFIKTLYKEIDQSIIESHYLSEYGHVGHVVLTFEITPQGKLVENHFYAQAEDPILKVVAARAIRKALKNENEELIFPKESTIVKAQFAWSDYSTCDRIKGTKKNFLSFCKYGEYKVKNFTKSEKTLTYLSAIYQHGPWAVEDIQKYNKEEDHRNEHFDPFEEMRRDPDFNLGS